MKLMRERDLMKKWDNVMEIRRLEEIKSEKMKELKRK